MLISSNSGANVNCRTDPTTDKDQQTVADGSSFTISCDLASTGNNQDHIQACSWSHYEPLNEQRGQNDIVKKCELGLMLSLGKYHPEGPFGCFRKAAQLSEVVGRPGLAKNYC